MSLNDMNLVCVYETGSVEFTAPTPLSMSEGFYVQSEYVDTSTPEDGIFWERDAIAMGEGSHDDPWVRVHQRVCVLSSDSLASAAVVFRSGSPAFVRGEEGDLVDVTLAGPVGTSMRAPSSADVTVVFETGSAMSISMPGLSFLDGYALSNEYIDISDPDAGVVLERAGIQLSDETSVEDGPDAAEPFAQVLERTCIVSTDLLESAVAVYVGGVLALSRDDRAETSCGLLNVMVESVLGAGDEEDEEDEEDDGSDDSDWLEIDDSDIL